MSSVLVLLPNGHRISVATTPNMQLIQILQTACAKHKAFDPARMRLKAGRKTLDLSLPFRLSGLANNAHLEAIVVDAAGSGGVEEKPTTIALQLADGRRVKSDFAPQLTLWEMLRLLDQQDSTLGLTTKTHSVVDALSGKPQDCFVMPTLRYLRQEFDNLAILRGTTLRSLGLQGEAAMMRVEFKPTSLPAANVELDVSAPPSAAAAAAAVVVTVPTPASSLVAEDASTAIATVPSPVAATAPTTTEMDTRSDAPPAAQPMDCQPDIAPSAPAPAPHPPTAIMPTPASLDCIPASFSAPPAHFPLAGFKFPDAPTPAPAAAPAASFAALPSPPAATLPPQAMDAEPAARAASAMTFGPPSLDCIPASYVAPPVEFPFANFKFPDKPTPAVDAPARAASRAGGVVAPPRNTVVFTLEGAETPLAAAAVDLGDDFYEVTMTDIEVMRRDATAALEEGELLTRALRDRRAADRHSKYTTARVRVLFPDRVVVQATFHPEEPLSALCAFVRECLADPATPFELYTSPPRVTIAPTDTSLRVAGLSPSSIVRVSITATPPLLTPALLAAMKTYDAAVYDAVWVPRDASSDEETAVAASASAAAAPASASGTSRPKSAARTAPQEGAKGGAAKFLRLSKK